MRLESRILVAVFVCCFVVAAGVSLAQQNERQPTDERPGAIARFSARLNFKLPTLFNFAKYKVKFNKAYESIAEEMRRAKLFLGRAFVVFISDVKYMHRQSSMYLKINSKSDWTVQERRAIMNLHDTGEKLASSDEDIPSLMADLDDIEQALEEIVANKDKSPDYAAIAAELEQSKRKKRSVNERPPKDDDRIYLDYRESGCLTPPKDQTGCGACYIFSTLALFEYHHCMQSGKLVPFSEQYAIDCGTFGELNGCRGGQEIKVAEFVGQFGLELAAIYPYRARQQQCPYSDNVVNRIMMGQLRIMNWKFWTLYRGDPRLTARNIGKILRVKGPLTISIDAYDRFVDYGGGVDLMKDCNPEVGHAMTIIGDGIEDGLEYWLIRNSWDFDFGIDGHYKLSKSMNPKCLVRIGCAEAKFIENNQHSQEALAYRVHKQMLLEDFKP